MADLILERFCFAPNGTFGKIQLSEVVIYTVERPWANNLPSVSCIPNGLYVCKPRKFFRGGYDAIEITGVPGRSHILFHKANLPTEVEGCIAPVSSLGALGGQWAGIGSAPAFAKLMEEFGGRTFQLSIVPIFGGHITE